MSAISYDPLWKTLVDRKMSRSDLKPKAGISSVTLAKLGKNESVTLDTIRRVCEALKVSISDVVEIVPSDSVLSKGSEPEKKKT